MQQAEEQIAQQHITDNPVVNASACPFHTETKEPEASTEQESDDSEEIILQVDANDPASLDAFWKEISKLNLKETLESEEAPKSSTKVESATVATKDVGNMTEEELLRLAEDVDRWINEDRR